MKFDPDKPIETFASDKLNFGPFARGLARAILNYDRPSSFVIGISGVWGAGKTSLLNLVRRAIEDEAAGPDDSPTTVILPYSPWLVGNRDVLLRDLLPLVGVTLQEKIKDKPKYAALRHNLSHLHRYAKAVRRVEMGLSIGAMASSGTPIGIKLSVIKKVTGAIARVFERSAVVTLDLLKQRAAEALQAFAVRIVIVMDDLDRLEPAEVLSVMRLVKATLDLPHITFLLAYDQNKVCDAIKHTLSVDGAEYVEKIIQLAVNIPETDSLDLARIVAEGLSEIFGPVSEEKAARVSESLWNYVRPVSLRTPRDITRILNGTAFGFSMLRAECDPADIFAVAALRATKPVMLGWVKEYLYYYFIIVPRTLDAKPYSERFLESFKKACIAERVDEQAMFDLLANVLPGLQGAWLNEKATLFGKRDPEDAAKAARDKRLSSEAHWRTYFDMTPGRQGFSEEWLEAFMSAQTESPQEAALQLLQFSSKTQPAGINVAERIVDRIHAEAKGDSLTEQNRIRLFLVLAIAADVIVKRAGAPGFWGAGMDQVLVWTARDILKPLSVEIRGTTVEKALMESPSLSWLSFFVRSELFAHGRAGDDPAVHRQILNEAWLDRICAVALKRIRDAAEGGKLLTDYDFVYPLFAWRDLSEVSAQAWVRKTIEDDRMLLRFVIGLKQLVQSSAGNFWRVDPRSVEVFTHLNTVVARLQNLATGQDQELKEQAIEALGLLERSRDL